VRLARVWKLNNKYSVINAKNVLDYMESFNYRQITNVNGNEYWGLKYIQDGEDISSIPRLLHHMP
jgi:hypothetical protein